MEHYKINMNDYHVIDFDISLDSKSTVMVVELYKSKEVSNWTKYLSTDKLIDLEYKANSQGIQIEKPYMMALTIQPLAVSFIPKHPYDYYTILSDTNIIELYKIEHNNEKLVN